jgi:hypothetical protein
LQGFSQLFFVENSTFCALFSKNVLFFGNLVKKNKFEVKKELTTYLFDK